MGTWTLRESPRGVLGGLLEAWLPSVSRAPKHSSLGKRVLEVFSAFVGEFKLDSSLLIVP